MKQSWQWFKLGVPPLVITLIGKYASCWIWGNVNNWIFHPVNNLYLNVFITVAILFVLGCLYGYLVSRKWFEKIAKEYLIKIPFIGWLIVVIVLPKRKLNLVEVRTTWGPTPEEGNWEYALETCDPWEEDGVIWHRVHTLCVAGKLYSRIGNANIRECRAPPHKIWLTVFSLGLF